MQTIFSINKHWRRR